MGSKHGLKLKILMVKPMLLIISKLASEQLLLLKQKKMTKINKNCGKI